MFGALIQKFCSGSPMCGPIPFPDVMYYMAIILGIAVWTVFQFGLYYRKIHPPQIKSSPEANHSEQPENPTK
jgi:hypothetical protein